MCHMSNLHCPNCNHLIGTLTPSATPSPNPALDASVSLWAARQDWSGKRPSRDLFDAYREDTGDGVTTHRQWSLSMQRVGFTKTKAAQGVRAFHR